MDKENKEVYSCFVNEEECNVLVVSDNTIYKSCPSRYNIIQAIDEREMLQIIWDNPITMAVIDLTYKSSGMASNALGIDSVGMNCFEVLQEKAPQIPIYIVMQESYGAEDRKAILMNGVRDLCQRAGGKGRAASG